MRERERGGGGEKAREGVKKWEYFERERERRRRRKSGNIETDVSIFPLFYERERGGGGGEKAREEVKKWEYFERERERMRR